jgi:hypothetical protein
MSRNRSVVIRTLVTAMAAIALALGGAQLSAGTALAATTVQSAPATAQTAAAATHWIIYSESLADEDACNELGLQIVENHVLGALDWVCSPTVVKGACSPDWTLELELPGGDAVSTEGARAAELAGAAC